MATEFDHIFLSNVQKTEDFTPRGGGPRYDVPKRDRETHSARLQRQWAAIWARVKEHEESRTAVSIPTKSGVYVEFEGAPGHDLVTKSLENRNTGIRLLSVYTVRSAGDTEVDVTRATVFIPDGKQDQFLKKINEYAKEETKKGNPRHAALMQSVENMRLAVLESFWRDEISLLPEGTSSEWCEIWLRGTGDGVERRFQESATAAGIDLAVSSDGRLQKLRFPERTVVLGRATRQQLADLIESSPDIAEFRRGKETARFFLELENRDQTKWVRDLHARLSVNGAAEVAVCILDTGANNGHILLQPILADDDRHAIEPEWGVNDHHGHGTLMCGIVAFGDLAVALQGSHLIHVEHCLESVKILPPKGANNPDLYGDITIQGMSRATIQAPDRTRIGCMAVASEDGRDWGRPSSWSAAIDKYTSGYDDERRHLFVLSAGNKLYYDDGTDYPDANLECSVHDPGQSWNALTVGAYTEKSLLSTPDLRDHTPLAQPGELSPFSSTSSSWDGKWPAKPDIVLEGGNLAKAPGDEPVSEYDDLSLLSTGYRPTQRQFDAMTATSAAAAEAARLAALVQAQYPEAWPETVRALMVHSADWPIALKRQFLGSNGNGEYAKTEYGRLLRIAGYGVPNLGRALASASNSLTLVSEAELQPYTKKEGRSDYSTKDMHMHRLPWPRDVLLSLGEAPILLKVTLSYFIEPGPGEVGWKDKYRYASHGLRFDLNTPGEDELQFSKRLNVAARDDGERPGSNSGSNRWLIGANSRNTGSIHSDIWKGTAADVASCNLVGIFPVIGWWRERAWLGRWNRKARYSLVVSLSTPDESIDIFTPVAVQLGIPVQAST